MLQVICRSSILRDLLQSGAMRESMDLPFSESRAKDIMWIVFYIDMQISSLTQAPALLQSPGPEMATVYAINAAAYNVANYRRSSSTFLLSVSLAMAIELIKLTRRILPARSPTGPQLYPALFSKLTSPIVVREWNKARTELQTWDYMLQHIFPENEASLPISL